MALARKVRQLGVVAVRFAAMGRNALALFGLCVLSLALAEGWRPSPDQALGSGADSAIAASVSESRATPVVRRTDPRRRALSEYFARRFRVAADATDGIVGAAYDSGRQVGLDPLLILAVVAIESGFNPVAESGMGARGLMQIIPKHHLALLREHGGERAMLDPPTNILLGSRILKSYVSQLGSVEAGLQFYNGALGDLSSGYAQKVFAERARIEEWLQNPSGSLKQARLSDAT
jgi:soluble lytic murein transglycosylase-like protein